MRIPIKLTEKATGRSIYITIFERELYLSGIFTFEDLYEICQYEEQEELNLNCEVMPL